MKLYIKYMVSLRCRMIVKAELQKLGLSEVAINLGEIEILENITEDQHKQLKKALLSSGLELLDDQRNLLIDKIKLVVVEMIHYEDELPPIDYADYISEKLGYDYAYLSEVFSEIKGMTIKQFIIIHKIERVKELLMYENLTLTEIAYRLQYSNVAHLSNQFKKITGLSPTFFKQIKQKRQVNL